MLMCAGIEQLGTPWSDGMPGLSQRPILPGSSFVYRWTANEYGMYFYHSHLKSQISDGLFGPLYIRPSNAVTKPFDRITASSEEQGYLAQAEERPNVVSISDWTHVTSSMFTAIEQEADLDVYCSQSILINGKGRVICLSPQQQEQELAAPFKEALNGTKLHPSGCAPFIPLGQGTYSHNFSAVPANLIYGCQETWTPIEDFRVQQNNHWASFHFISAALVQAPIVSIDQHPMWVYAVDGRYVEPVRVNGLQIYNGERYSVMVKLDQRPSTYRIRASNFGLNQLISGVATLTYAGRFWHRPNPAPYFTYGGVPTSANVTLLNTTTQIVPFPNVPPAKTADATHVLRVKRLGGSWRWTLSGTASYPINYSSQHPLLWYPNSTAARNQSLVIRTVNGTWVDVVFVVEADVNDPVAPPHAMHKHSNKAYILGAGVGDWTWDTVAQAAQAQPASFNFVNPPYRDGFATPTGTGQPVWLVIRYEVVNPGAFLLHCHIQDHLAGGMAVALLDGVEAFPAIPKEYGPNAGW